MMHLLITCEHGGKNIPARYKSLFKSKKTLLNSHQGYDIGALAVAKNLNNKINSKLFYCTTSRLIIELNRSLHHHNLFSNVTKKLLKEEKQKIIKEYYFPYRLKVEKYIVQKIKSDGIIHLSIHSFTPVLKGKIRKADIGLLFDSKNNREKYLCTKLKHNLLKYNPGYNIRFNYPYLGTMDGFTKYLRNIFPADSYLGIEIEVNQKYFDGKKIKDPNKLKTDLSAAINLTLKEI